MHVPTGEAPSPLSWIRGAWDSRITECPADLRDTSSQIEAELRSEAEGECEELRHGELARICLAQRLHACRGGSINLQLTSGDDVEILVRDVSKHWARGETARGELLIHMTAIAALQGLPVCSGRVVRQARCLNPHSRWRYDR